MQVKAYLKIKKDGSLSVYKFTPSVAADEVVTLLNFDIPDSMFINPVLEANIKINPTTSTAPEIEIHATALVDWISKKP